MLRYAFASFDMRLLGLYLVKSQLHYRVRWANLTGFCIMKKVLVFKLPLCPRPLDVFRPV